MTTISPLLVLGTGSLHYREHSLRGLAATRPLVLADDSLPGWASPYVQDVLRVDLSDAAAVAAAVKQFAEHRPLGGVCTYLEHHVELAAQLADQLGLPGHSPASVAACRDKALTRRRFHEHGVPSPRSVAVAVEEEAVHHARLLGYPVVVKPRGMGGSAGVRRADTDAEVRDAYQRATWESVLGLDAYAVDGVLVEEYLDGPEISAETVVVDGYVHIVAITCKSLGAEPQFLETGHSVDARDPLLDDPAVSDAVTRAVRALGLTHGVLHVELRLTAHGPFLIEVNSRPGGDLIPRLVELATGVDLMAVAADLATGTDPDLALTHERAAAVAFLYPTVSGRVSQQTAPADLREEPWLERLVWTRYLGQIVSGPPRATIADRLAHWVVVGESAQDCQQRLASVRERISSQVGGPGHTTACIS
ncbi:MULTISPECIES: ATP-grasp domain-containing protein [unclassified Streptomyces]|uniref:ATP-grasp domain-containing protein n=1 Tax=unclassified Streptomyces TaxID=2593676 RepID=UPI000746DE9C|nr:MULTISPECIES: ATP-grasp domain-containing protein [unclassified Streptomyces]KUL73917.1 hypothetical protein ADL34_18805 [Streptomyces sp. NRRL WC-3605]KUL74366.1 hypothetical protein ADL33_17885 [Streptomyces sp. NRRL WC-3604]